MWPLDRFAKRLAMTAMGSDDSDGKGSRYQTDWPFDAGLQGGCDILEFAPVGFGRSM